MGIINEIPDDDDQVVFFDPSRVVRLVDDESGRITFDLSPTDNPDKYRMTVTAPAPKLLYIKRATL